MCIVCYTYTIVYTLSYSSFQAYLIWNWSVRVSMHRWSFVVVQSTDARVDSQSHALAYVKYVAFVAPAQDCVAFFLQFAFVFGLKSVLGKDMVLMMEIGYKRCIGIGIVVELLR